MFTIACFVNDRILPGIDTTDLTDSDGSFVEFQGIIKNNPPMDWTRDLSMLINTPHRSYGVHFIIQHIVNI